jgi:hypothetical protein
MTGRYTKPPVNVGAGKNRLRRTVVSVDQAGGRTYSEEPWEWKATQRPPFVVRAERRAANKRARRARKGRR